MQYDYTYSNLSGEDVDVFVCHCGRRHHVQAGGDIAACQCEFENAS